MSLWNHSDKLQLSFEYTFLQVGVRELSTMLCSLLFYTKSQWYWETFFKKCQGCRYQWVIFLCWEEKVTGSISGFVCSLANDFGGTQWKAEGDLAKICHSFHKSLYSTDRSLESYFSMKNNAFHFHRSFSLSLSFFSSLKKSLLTTKKLRLNCRKKRQRLMNCKQSYKLLNLR